MRLLKTQHEDGDLGRRTTLELHEFTTAPAGYAILSHTWGGPRDEVLFSDMLRLCDQDVLLDESSIKVDLTSERGLRLTEKIGWKKLEYSLRQAARDGYDWLWADTVCIDKSSSAELSEAINSMWSFYEHSSVCYVYLEDIHADAGLVYYMPDMDTKFKPLRSRKPKALDCRWATRGWTLQELLAPARVHFFNHDWLYLGNKQDLAPALHATTKIDMSVLVGQEPVQSVSVAKRMSWAAHRRTTRLEDRSYSLMGLFGVNMPMLYGEGDKAFFRLQEEIMRKSNDHSLLAWKKPERFDSSQVHGLLADSPADFSESSEYHPYPHAGEPLTMTSRGLSTSLGLHPLDNIQRYYTAKLSCPHPLPTLGFLTITLVRLNTGPRDYVRIHCGGIGYASNEHEIKPIFVPQESLSSVVQDIMLLPKILRVSMLIIPMGGLEQWDDTVYRIIHVWDAPFGDLSARIFGDPQSYRGKSDLILELPRDSTGLLAVIVCEAVAIEERVAIFLSLNRSGEIEFDLVIPSSSDNAIAMTRKAYGHGLGRVLLRGRHSLTMTGWQQLEEGRMSYDLKLRFQETQGLRPKRVDEERAQTRLSRWLKTLTEEETMSGWHAAKQGFSLLKGSSKR